MKVVFLDTETSSFPAIHPWQHGAYLCSVGLAINNEPVQTWLLRHKTEPVKLFAQAAKEIRAAFRGADLIVAHNAKFDLNWMKTIGITFPDSKIWCTQVVDYLLNGQYKLKYAMNSVAERYGLEQKFDDMAKYWDDGYDTDEIPADVHLRYLAQDVEVCRQIYYAQKDKVEVSGLTKLASLCLEVTDMLSDMEVLGFKFDREEAEQALLSLDYKLKELDMKLLEKAGIQFNPSSSAQLSAILYGGVITTTEQETYFTTLKSGEVKEKKRRVRVDRHIPGLGFTPLDNSESDSKEGVFSTDKKTLSLLHARTKKQKEFLNILIERSKTNKMSVTFMSRTKGGGGLINQIGVDGGIHPQFNQTIAITGRLTSSNPNGQNLPRKGASPIKACFKPRNGVLINGDLKQIEFRVAAELSRDPVMMKEIKDGLDTHRANAIEFFGAGEYPEDSQQFKDLRQVAKIFTFRLLFGGGAVGFFRDGSMPRYSLKKWQDIEKAYLEKYKGLRDWRNENVRKAYTDGYLRNPSGRILRFVPERKRGIWQINEADVYNYPVQSSSADVMYLCMVELRKRFRSSGIKSSIVLQVHDSVVIDAYPEEVNKICVMYEEMCKELPKLCKEYWGWDVDVPLGGDCEVGLDYGNTIPYNAKADATMCTVTYAKSKEDFFDETYLVTTYTELATNEQYNDYSKKFKVVKIKFK